MAVEEPLGAPDHHVFEVVWPESAVLVLVKDLGEIGRFFRVVGSHDNLIKMPDTPPNVSNALGIQRVGPPILLSRTRCV